MSKKLGKTASSSKAGTIHTAEFEKTVAHKHVPGRAYSHTNPTEKLISMIGGGFFNEPRYYDKNRSYAEFYKELREKGCISSVITGDDGLSEQAREVVETAQAVAVGPNPEDLLILAAWLRDPKKGMKLRYTPQIMLCIAAANKQTQPFVKKYARSIIRRADEIRDVFAAYRHMYCEQKNGRYVGSIPHCLRKALGIAFASFNDYQLLKYNTDDTPSFKDVALMLKGQDVLRAIRSSFTGQNQPQRDLANWPLSKPMFEYIVNGKLIGGSATLDARQKFFAEKDIKKVDPAIVEAAALTWENLISHFGASKASWEMAIPLMSEMALMRNLRNFEKHEIGKPAWDLVHKKLDMVVDTNQLPFRFFSADREVSGQQSIAVAESMLDKSCMNIPALNGVTVVMVDNSGSAVGCAVGGNSKLKVSDAGNILAAIAAKRNGPLNTMVGVFGDGCIWVPLRNDSCMTIKKKIDSVAQTEPNAKYNPLWCRRTTHAGVGGGTETGLWLGIHDLTERNIKVDRFILISDFCCYTQGDVNCGVNMTSALGYKGDKATIQSLITKYKSKVNPNAWVHAVDLHGQGQPQIRPGQEKAQILSGWSEQIFALINAAEGIVGNENSSSEEKEIPALTYIRANYKIEG